MAPDKKTTRILLVASGPGVGGGEKNLADIARCLSKAEGFETSAVVPADGLLRAELAGLGCPVLVTPMSGVASIRSAGTVARFISGQGVDLVHAHGTRAALFARLAARRVGRPCIYTVHGLHYLNYTSGLKRVAYTWTDRALRPRTAAFICVCESDLKKGTAARVVDPLRSSVIYNGIEPAVDVGESDTADLRSAFEIGDEEEVVVTVARFHVQKGHPYLLRAMVKVLERHPRAKLILIGAGETEPEMRRLAADLGLGKRVVFAGERPDGASVIALAHVVAIPSLWEGLPYVALEAMRAGKPVVASDVDGIPEAVRDARTGLLVPPRDPGALAAAISRVLDDAEFAARMGDEGRHVVSEKFSIDEMCARVVDLYRKLVPEVSG